MKTLIITLIFDTIPKKKIDIISTSDKSGNKNNFLKRFFLCRGFTNSPIDIHEFSLELSHLFGTASFDSCFCSKPNFLLKTEKDANRTKYGCILFFKNKKEDFDPEDSK